MAKAQVFPFILIWVVRLGQKSRFSRRLQLIELLEECTLVSCCSGWLAFLLIISSRAEPCCYNGGQRLHLHLWMNSMFYIVGLICKQTWGLCLHCILSLYVTVHGLLKCCHHSDVVRIKPAQTKPVSTGDHSFTVSRNPFEKLWACEAVMTLADSERCKYQWKPQWTQEQLLPLAQLVNVRKDIIKSNSESS